MFGLTFSKSNISSNSKFSSLTVEVTNLKYKKFMQSKVIFACGEDNSALSPNSPWTLKPKDAFNLSYKIIDQFNGVCGEKEINLIQRLAFYDIQSIIDLPIITFYIKDRYEKVEINFRISIKLSSEDKEKVRHFKEARFGNRGQKRKTQSFWDRCFSCCNNAVDDEKTAEFTQEGSKF